jgi:hypothetical protein
MGFTVVAFNKKKLSNSRGAEGIDSQVGTITIIAA